MMSNLWKIITWTASFSIVFNMKNESYLNLACNMIFIHPFLIWSFEWCVYFELIELNQIMCFHEWLIWCADIIVRICLLIPLLSTWLRDIRRIYLVSILIAHTHTIDKHMINRRACIQPLDAHDYHIHIIMKHMCIRNI